MLLFGRLALTASLGLLLFAGSSVTNAGSAEPRTWTSRAGSQFSGSLKDREGASVTLVGADGSERIVTLEQLSPPDLDYIRQAEQQRHTARLGYFQTGGFMNEQLPESAEVKGLRHVVQRESFCVPASAEMVLRFYGFSFDQDYLAQISSRASARSEGTNFGDLVHSLRNSGIDSVGLSSRSGSPNDDRFQGIKAAIAEGRPVLISYETTRSGHAVVAVGYNDRRRAFWVLDPAAAASPQRLDYKVLETILTGAVVMLPRPDFSAFSTDAADPARQDFLRLISDAIRASTGEDFSSIAERLNQSNASSRLMDLNRRDLSSSQGQTRSFARQQGIEYVQLALRRGAVVVAPQQYENGQGCVLVYGEKGNGFEGVEFLPDGTFRRGEVRALDFSLRWLQRSEREFQLPVIEVEPSTLSAR